MRVIEWPTRLPNSPRVGWVRFHRSLHGPTGVGKSHLLAAICSQAREQRPELTTLVLSAEQFTTNFLQALRGTGLPGFRRSCRSVDLLAIDDLHFFIGKRATLLELQSTDDSLHRAGKQILFASDRDVEGLAGLGSELTGGFAVASRRRFFPLTMTFDEELSPGWPSVVASIFPRR